MDRFDALQAFARVVESGSFTKAALTLHLSRTTVTQLVQQLEARLRVKLLHRTTRRVQVTPDGAAYYERVVRLLADMDDADASVSTAAAAPRGRLRVDVPSPLARLVLIPALPAFHAQYPDILLHMGVSDRPVDMVGDNVDCVVRGGALTNPALVARHVGDLQLRVYAAPSYLQRAGTPEHPEALEAPAPPHRGFSMGTHWPAPAVRDAPWYRTCARPGPRCLRCGRRQRLPGRRPGGPGRALATRLHGPPPRGHRRAGAPAAGLDVGADAAVRGLPTPTACERQGTGVH